MEGSEDLVSRLEQSFQKSIQPLTLNSKAVTLSEEQSLTAELNISEFVKSCRTLEAFFLEKKQQLALHRPDLLSAQEFEMNKVEFKRKEDLIQKHHEHLQQWTAALGAQASGTVGSSPGQWGQPTSGATGNTQQAGGSQGPLAYLEKTTSNIGVSEQRR